MGGYSAKETLEIAAVPILRTTSRFRFRLAPSLGLALVLLYLLLVSLASLPQFHQAIHPDGNQPGHNCVVTLLAQGQIDLPICDISLPPVLVSCGYSTTLFLSSPA